MGERWTAEDRVALETYYRITPPAVFSLDQIAGWLGRSYAAVALKASRWGLAQQDRPRSDATCLIFSKAQSIRANTEEGRKAMTERSRLAYRNGHPKGFLGRKHSEKAKEIISAKSISSWAGKSEEALQLWKRRGAETKVKNGTAYPERPNATWKAGWREIGGKRVYYRSRWEANYARVLEWMKAQGEVLEWLHEPETFWFDGVKRGCVSYLPDFRVTFKGGNIEYHEVKGWMDDRSKTKIKRMAKYHPKVVLRVIEAKAYRVLKKQMAGLIPDWE